MNTLTHRGVAVQERMRQAKTLDLVLVRKTCGHGLPDGSKCSKRMTADEKMKYVFCPACLKNMKEVKK